MRFGEYLIKKDLISEKELETALEMQRQTKVPLGKLAVETGCIDKLKNMQLLLEQIETNRRYGDIALEQGLLTEKKIEELIEVQKAESIPLGKILADTTGLSKYQLVMALKEFIKIKDEEQR